MLTFPDGSKVGVVGLTEAMEELYRQEKPPTYDTAKELTKRLEEQNYFVPSERNIYTTLLLSEYKLFLENKARIGENDLRRE